MSILPPKTGINSLHVQGSSSERNDSVAAPTFGTGRTDSTATSGTSAVRLPLLPQHLADLRGCGLSDEQILRCQSYSEEDLKRVGRLLGWDGPAKGRGPCLMFPFIGRVGRPAGYERAKPDRPREVDGKLVKYESPIGRPNHAY